MKMELKQFGLRGALSEALPKVIAFFKIESYVKSNFDNVGENEKYLIQKFLERTLLYNKRMMELVEHLGFISIDVESISNTDELFR